MPWKVRVRINDNTGVQEVLVPSHSAQGAKQAVKQMYNVRDTDIYGALYVQENDSYTQKIPSYSSGGGGTFIALIFFGFLFIGVFTPWLLLGLGAVLGLKMSKHSLSGGLVLALILGSGGFILGQNIQKHILHPLPVQELSQPAKKDR